MWLNFLSVQCAYLRRAHADRGSKGTSMKLYKWAAFALCFLAGCSDGPAKDAVKTLLNDPESARFTYLKTGTAPGDTCGYVNAKNRMGGYVGDTPFFYEKSTSRAALVVPVTESDLRSLWLGIKTNNFSDDLVNLRGQCQRIDRWAPVCGNPYPHDRHPLCSDIQGDGSGLYEKLKARYGA
jgi:hypothetical protein